MKRKNPIVISCHSMQAPIPKPLQLAFLSDLHCFDNRLILDRLQTLRPDGVLVGGDFMHSAQHNEEGFDFLRRSAAAYPTFCSLGNHESLYPGDIRAAVAQTGAVLLDDAWVRFGGITLGGLSSASCRSLPSAEGCTHTPDLDWLGAFSALPGYKLLLCHHPEYYPAYLRSLPIDLILSGHVHGGQWRLFGHGVYAPGQGFFPRYTSGLYEGRLLVGRGIGNMTPVPRINNPPEILSVSLHPMK